MEVRTIESVTLRMRVLNRLRKTQPLKTGYPCKSCRPWIPEYTSTSDRRLLLVQASPKPHQLTLTAGLVLFAFGFLLSSAIMWDAALVLF